jgi:DNA topoisomerase-1
MKWKTLIHQGVAFPPEHEPRGFSLRILGQTVKLTPFQEEMAVAWGRKKETPYVKDPVFQKNFLKDFLKEFPREFRGAKIEDIDFTEIHQWIEAEKRKLEDLEFRKKRSAERKAKREELKALYGTAEVDGQPFDVGNYMIEPPGIFMGRGEHPMRGKWKPRIRPEDVTLNLGENAPVPPGNWGGVVHDHDSTWLARWMDKLTEKDKYVWLSDAATIRQQADQAKYDKAKKLGRSIDAVIEKMYEAMRARDRKRQMVSTAVFLIYRLAMRVGDEKDPDEADTVGASTLRVEHVKIEGNRVEFDFLGKDSVRWVKSIALEGRDEPVLKNLIQFMKGKKPSALVFSDINSRSVNEFLGSIQKGLSAKVFRTYLATEVVRTYLAGLDSKFKHESAHAKLYHAKMANLQAAVTCNHKRAIPKNFEETLEKKRKLLEELKGKEAKTDKQQERLRDREEKLRMQLELAVETRDYNLGTSLRNYIDPRVVKSWCDYVDLDWTKLYTKTLQRKFQWVENAAPKWKKLLEDPMADVQP